MLIADAVFEGGGIKAIGFVGALCCLEGKGLVEYRDGYKIDKINEPSLACLPKNASIFSR